jgi:hypothetical protein
MEDNLVSYETCMIYRGHQPTKCQLALGPFYLMKGTRGPRHLQETANLMSKFSFFLHKISQNPYVSSSSSPCCRQLVRRLLVLRLLQGYLLSHAAGNEKRKHANQGMLKAWRKH